MKSQPGSKEAREGIATPVDGSASDPTIPNFEEVNAQTQDLLALALNMYIDSSISWSNEPLSGEERRKL